MGPQSVVVPGLHVVAGPEVVPGGAEELSVEVVQGVSVVEAGGAVVGVVVSAVVVAGAEVQDVVGCAVTQAQRDET
jgi:hypothetical protein